MGRITVIEFRDGDGNYKMCLDWLTKKEVEEIVKIVNNHDKEKRIQACIEMVLSDASETRFKDYGTNLRDCLDWLRNAKDQIVDSPDKPWFQMKTKEVSHMFKEGDIVINKKTGNISQIKDVKSNEYGIWPLYSDIKGFLPKDEVEQDYKLWNINDAKRGDVITNGETIFLLDYVFAEIEPEYLNQGITNSSIREFHYYFAYSFRDNKIHIQDKFGPCIPVFMKPASKEDRDLLFASLEYNGYRWDGEKIINIK